MVDWKHMEKQVRDWQASGLSAVKFSAGKDFTASALRGWAFRLRRRQATQGGPADSPVRLVRVIAQDTPRGAPQSMPCCESAPGSASPGQSSLVLQVQGVRIAVAAGFDAATLSAVLDVVEQRTRCTRRSA